MAILRYAIPSKETSASCSSCRTAPWPRITASDSMSARESSSGSRQRVIQFGFPRTGGAMGATRRLGSVIFISKVADLLATSFSSQSVARTMLWTDNGNQRFSMENSQAVILDINPHNQF
jgi:hypothetical protein